MTASRASCRRPVACRGQRGVSLVEIMVGLAVGLFVVGGALSSFVSNVTSSRRMLVEARMHQDLRAAADLISRDLRRAGYWGNAIRGTIAVGSGSATTPNPYGAIATAASSVGYNYSTAANGSSAENDALDVGEQFGFRIAGDGVIQMQMAANNWQDLTDKNVMKVTSLSIDSTGTASIPMGSACATPVAANAANYPYIVLRQYTLTLTAQAADDASVTRQLRIRVKARNDVFTGACA